jgi:hypothetical protein
MAISYFRGATNDVNDWQHTYDELLTRELSKVGDKYNWGWEGCCNVSERRAYTALL